MNMTIEDCSRCDAALTATVLGVTTTACSHDHLEPHHDHHELECALKGVMVISDKRISALIRLTRLEDV